MKFAAALLGCALALTAPLAVLGAPCANPANDAVVNNLVLTSTLKRTTATGGSKVSQVITLTNKGSTDIGGIIIETGSTPDLPYWLSPPYKRHKKTMAQGNKPVLSERQQSNGARSTAFTLAAGKSFRATITYKANNCPVNLAAPVTATVWISTDGATTACRPSNVPLSTTVNLSKNTKKCP